MAPFLVMGDMTRKITIELEEWEVKELIAILERQIQECEDNPYLSPKVAIRYKEILSEAIIKNAG